MRSAKKQERKYRTVNTAAPHALKKRLLTLALSLAFLLTCLPAALAVDLNVDAGFYFKQSRGGTCTLASAAMMLRRRAYFDGLSDWTNVTENSVRSTAWANGLAHSFTYKEMQVGYATLPSGLQSKTAVLISLLEQHPEGIVLYDRTQPHAVLLTDYTNGIFYCSDPAGNIGYGRIPITSSSVSIARASCYWYVTADHNSVAAQADGLRKLIAVIGDSANAGSVGLRRALGFTEVGVLRAMGWKHGAWRDIVLMEKPLGAADSIAPE